MITISPVQTFNDNYVWVLSRSGGDTAVVVDPGEAFPVMAFLDQHQLRAAAVLLTHHHHDHVGGAHEVAERFRCPVYGPKNENIAAVDHPVGEGDSIELQALGLSFDVCWVPGHTIGHVAYRWSDVLLCGDTLFAAGCGRIFEGTADQMYASLSRLAALPPDTRVFCAHEYTLANLRFALTVEPNNPQISERLRDCEALRSAGRQTLPSTIAEELRSNPFLRSNAPEVVDAACRRAGRRLEPGADVFREIRTWKDSF